MTLLAKIEALEATVAGLKGDAQKTDDGNKAAGTRVRVGLMAVKKECDTLRKAVSEMKSAG